MLWATSPGATELETRVVDWMCRAMGLPEAFLSTTPNGGGCIQATASESTLAAMLAARQRTRARLRARGATRPEFVVYTSTQAHSSVVKAAMIAGIAEGPGDPHVRLVPVDERGAMREDELTRVVREDAAAGRTPFYVCATVGTTGITAIDRVDRIGAALQGVEAWRENAGWLHVDAAHAGALLILPEFRGLRAGLDGADSLCFNPHKWMLTTFDCDLFWTRDRKSLISSMSINPAYLRNEATESGAVFDYRDWHVPLGRRFRSLKLWLVLRHYGLEGIRAYLREHVRLAAMVESWVGESPALELCAARTMNLVVFRPRARTGESAEGQDARTRALMDALNRGGSMFLSPVVLPLEWSGTEASEMAGRLAIRMCIGATLVEERHVLEAWRTILGEITRTR
jgi:aromatic-L-amino-acid decarboxylase